MYLKNYYVIRTYMSTKNPKNESPTEILNWKENNHVAKRKRYDWIPHRSNRWSSRKSQVCSIRRSPLAPALRCCGYRHLAPEEESPLKPLPSERIGNGLGWKRAGLETASRKFWTRLRLKDRLSWRTTNRFRCNSKRSTPNITIYRPIHSCVSQS